jgi:hypothetical protein
MQQIDKTLRRFFLSSKTTPRGILIILGEVLLKQTTKSSLYYTKAGRKNANVFIRYDKKGRGGNRNKSARLVGKRKYESE